MKNGLPRPSGSQPERHQSRRTVLKAGLGTLGLIGLDPFIRRVSAGSPKTFKARLGHGQAVTTPLHHACVKFAELAKERSGGRLDVGVFPSSQLGTMVELAEAVRMGTIEMYGGGNGFVEPFAPKISLVNLPGLMRDLDHAYKVMYLFAFKEVYEKSLLPVGIRPLGFVSNDFRHFTNNKRPINTLADLKGLKIRSVPTKVMMDTIAALGASPVPMDWSEVFSALQQGVVDGQENPFIQVWSAKFYEIQKYLTLTYHTWDTYILMINEKFFQSLDPDLQKIVVESGREASDFGWKEMGKINDDLLGTLKGLGMTVTEIPRQDVQNAVKPVWNTWTERLGPEGKILIQRAVEIK
jgi:tripartite ATP-independent transporter DctP family solute receptor